MIIKNNLNKEKFQLVLERNTFFFRNDKFEEKFEGYISSIASLLLILKDKIKGANINEKKKAVVVEFIRKNPDGLNAILTLLGISRESLLRIVSFVRIINDETLSGLVNFSRWGLNKEIFKSELNQEKIVSLIKENEAVASGIVNLFFEGITVPVLRQILPLFEFKKFNFAKISFSTESLVDTITRYRAKGQYKAFEDNNPTGFIKDILVKNKIPFDTNQKMKHLRRSIDLAIPNTLDPKIIIESSYVVTTASGMGDKAKTEMELAKDIKRYYPKASFIGFVDGIGWYVRQGDLQRIVSAFDEVFTFQKTELKRFLGLVQNKLNGN